MILKFMSMIFLLMSMSIVVGDSDNDAYDEN